jgi:hypothetical protein
MRSSRRCQSSALSAPDRSMRPRANPPRSERPQRSWFDPPSRA